MISLDKCDGICDTFDDLSMKVCVPSKTKDLNVTVFNMVKRMNEPKTLVKNISGGCKCKFNSTK